ncbi:39S ribosomal protein L34 [Blattella germanica]|nr:39S ribosomal protein L34 [Blattella germanica]
MSTCIKPQSILADKGGQFIPRQTICRSFSNCFQNNDLLQPDGFWNFTSIRTKIRCHFPRPCEDKRIKRHGFKKRMSTPAGRRIIMNRILKGRHVLTH